MNLKEQTNTYYVFYKWFEVMAQMEVRVIGFVIMPNHFHAILYIPPTCTKTLNALVGGGKRFITYEIIKQLRAFENQGKLDTLTRFVCWSNEQKGVKSRVFAESFDRGCMLSRTTMRQKLNYIHDNPVSKKWKLAVDRSEYLHSSANFYDNGVANQYVTHLLEAPNPH